MTKEIKEVIVVEGKTDTQKLQTIFGKNIKTIETQGLALNDTNLELIKKINAKQGIIIFTDPDGPGKRIREKIMAKLGGNVKNAFVTKKDMVKGSKKIGVAEAEPKAIKAALEKLIDFNNNAKSISWEQYLANDFYKKENRIKIANHFAFDKKVSSKTMYKWLNWMNLDVDDVKKIIKGDN